MTSWGVRALLFTTRSSADSEADSVSESGKFTGVPGGHRLLRRARRGARREPRGFGSVGETLEHQGLFRWRRFRWRRQTFGVR